MDAMARAQIGRLPVVDDHNTLAGIVTLGSLALRSKKDKETLAAAKAVSSRSVKAALHQDRPADPNTTRRGRAEQRSQGDKSR
jgi:CBS-domain-containing membrane protein